MSNIQIYRKRRAIEKGNEKKNGFLSCMVWCNQRGKKSPAGREWTRLGTHLIPPFSVHIDSVCSTGRMCVCVCIGAKKEAPIYSISLFLSCRSILYRMAFSSLSSMSNVVGRRAHHWILSRDPFGIVHQQRLAQPLQGCLSPATPGLVSISEKLSVFLSVGLNGVDR